MKNISFKFILFFLITLIACTQSFAEGNHRIIKIAGDINSDDLELVVDSAVKNNDDLLILDLSKANFIDSEGENIFVFYHGSERVQGIILPESLKSFVVCDFPDLKFIQFTTMPKFYDDYCLASNILRYVFLPKKAKVPSAFKNYNSAKFINEDCFKYAVKKEIDLYSLIAAYECPDFKLNIPPEKREISESITSETENYKIIVRTEKSEKVDFSISRIEVKNPEYKIIADKMNDFISWNLNRFYDEEGSMWIPRNPPLEFYTGVGIYKYKNYMSIGCSFTYYTGFPHETHEEITFCYDTNRKKFVNLLDVTGMDEDTLYEEFAYGLEISESPEIAERFREMYDREYIKNQAFEINDKGQIVIWFSDYQIDRYEHSCILSCKPVP